MNHKRALAIFEAGQVVELYSVSPHKCLDLACSGKIIDLKIEKEEPLRLIITLDNDLQLEFLGTWGTNGQQCPKRPDA
jgi:hypothetical protein